MNNPSVTPASATASKTVENQLFSTKTKLRKRRLHQSLTYGQNMLLELPKV